MTRVGIIGVGWYGFKPTTPEVSFREMMFEAATRAYADAGIDPRRDIDIFLSCQEDFWEGIAIADEFAPEPIGGVLRPTVTVAGDGLLGVAQAYMLIKTGLARTVVVEAHAKPSDIETLQEIYELALDPLHIRPLGVKNPFFLAGLDATAYMERTGVDREYFALVAAKNKRNGLLNPRASYAAKIDVEDVLQAEPIVYPLTGYEIAGFTDAAIVMVLASEEVAKNHPNTVWLEGVGWATETGTGAVEWHAWGSMPSIRQATRMAYRMAGISDPYDETDFAEVEDRFSFMELLAIEEAGLASEGQAADMLEAGDFDFNGAYPVNPSGGSLAVGVSLEATGLARLLEAVLQLRGEAGGHQLSDAYRALVVSWRGPPSYTSLAAIVSID